MTASIELRALSSAARSAGKPAPATIVHSTESGPDPTHPALPGTTPGRAWPLGSPAPTVPTRRGCKPGQERTWDERAGAGDRHRWDEDRGRPGGRHGQYQRA